MNGIFPLDNFPHYPKNAVETFGSSSKHLIIANAGFNKDSRKAELEKGIAKIISYGSLFLANPDLPRRFELNAELNQIDQVNVRWRREGIYRLSVPERLILKLPL